MDTYQSNTMNNVGTSRSEPLGSSACHVCQGIGDLKNPRGLVAKCRFSGYRYWYLHHPNLRALLNSGEAGCCTCALLCVKLKEDARSRYRKDFSTLACETPREDSTSTAYFAQSQNDILAATQLAKLAKEDKLNGMAAPDLGVQGHGRVLLRFQCKEKTSPRGSKGHNKATMFVLNTVLYVDCEYFNSIDDPIDPEMQNRPSLDLLSDPHIGLINRWRDTCEKEHESCHKTVLNQTLPTRVLELLDPLDPSNKRNPVRLVETHRMMQGTYVCLSYCWGNVTEAQKGQTKKDNLASQLHGITYNELPSTVIDAIQICYKLGFRFLWVDRLCIVQDDRADWSREASRMCDIYSRAALTIAVSLCDDTSQSFLSKRRMSPFCEPRSSVIAYTDEETRLKGSLWIMIRDYWNSGHGPWYLEIPWDRFDPKGGKSNRWLDRAWTFQEWMLSPRVLHINTMTLWDCLDGYANELSRRYIDTPILSRDPMILGREVSWNSIIREYSRRDITFMRDRLPALAGLAARYRQITGYTYLAGLWLEDMPTSLLWKAGARHFGHILPENIWDGKQTIPSWSWASYDGVVLFDQELHGVSAKASIASFYCRYSPLGSISNVEEAWIDVEGYLSIVTEQRHGDGSSREEGFDDEELRLYVKAANAWWESYPDYENKHQDDAIAQADIYLLYFGFYDAIHVRVFCGLVLHECGFEDGRSCFRRLGSAELWQTYYDESALPGVESLWQQRLIRLV